MIISIVLIGISLDVPKDTANEKSNLLKFDYESNLFTVVLDEDNVVKAVNEGTALKTEFLLKPDLENIYEKIRAGDDKTVVVIPTFTVSAYYAPGFYTYYSGQCDEECLEVPIRDRIHMVDTSSANGVKILELLGYQTITDVDVDKNPEILEKYDKVILLHNEYVTKKMFDAITSHPKVVYLYPNALYAEVSVDYEKNTISLVRGHGFPTSDIVNGFDWEFDNTHPYEYDIKCLDWEFYEIDNGIMLNCYPENVLYKDQKLLEVIKEY